MGMPTDHLAQHEYCRQRPSGCTCGSDKLICITCLAFHRRSYLYTLSNSILLQICTVPEFARQYQCTPQGQIYFQRLILCHSCLSSHLTGSDCEVAGRFAPYCCVPPNDLGRMSLRKTEASPHFSDEAYLDARSVLAQEAGSSKEPRCC